MGCLAQRVIIDVNKMGEKCCALALARNKMAIYQTLILYRYREGGMLLFPSRNIIASTAVREWNTCFLMTLKLTACAIGHSWWRWSQCTAQLPAIGACDMRLAWLGWRGGRRRNPVIMYIDNRDAERNRQAHLTRGEIVRGLLIINVALKASTIINRGCELAMGMRELEAVSGSGWRGRETSLDRDLESPALRFAARATPALDMANATIF